jgi:hypothetical protein
MRHVNAMLEHLLLLSLLFTSSSAAGNPNCQSNRYPG